MSKKLLYYLSGLLLFCPNLAALAVTIYTNLPGQPSGSSGLGNFVDYLYKFAMMLAGILAFGAIVYGGIKYTLAAGNPTGQTEGKEWVKGALIGLLLLVGAYTILNIINPNLTSWNFLLSGVSVSTTATTSGCSSTNPTGSCPSGQSCISGTCQQSSNAQSSSCDPGSGTPMCVSGKDCPGLSCAGPCSNYNQPSCTNSSGSGTVLSSSCDPGSGTPMCVSGKDCPGLSCAGPCNNFTTTNCQ